MPSRPIVATRKREAVSEPREDETSIFIVEDHRLVRHMLGKLIRRNPDFTLCGRAATGEAALEQIPACQPKLVLVDVSLPGIDGIELIRILHERYPE